MNRGAQAATGVQSTWINTLPFTQQLIAQLRLTLMQPLLAILRTAMSRCCMQIHLGTTQALASHKGQVAHGSRWPQTALVRAARTVYARGHTASNQQSKHVFNVKHTLIGWCMLCDALATDVCDCRRPAVLSAC